MDHHHDGDDDNNNDDDDGDDGRTDAAGGARHMGCTAACGSINQFNSINQLIDRWRQSIVHDDNTNNNNNIGDVPAGRLRQSVVHDNNNDDNNNNNNNIGWDAPRTARTRAFRRRRAPGTRRRRGPPRPAPLGRGIDGVSPLSTIRITIIIIEGTYRGRRRPPRAARRGAAAAPALGSGPPRSVNFRSGGRM